MVIKAVKTILPLFVILCVTTSCWDSIDIENRDICTAVVVDRDKDAFTFYVEVAGISSRIQNPRSEQGAQAGGGQQPSTSIVKGSGKTYAEARESLDRELNKPVYLGAVQSLILTERLADSNIEEYTLRLRQMTEYRKTMDVIVTPDEPEDFLSVQPANASAVGFAIEDELETLRKLGQAYHLTLADLLQKFESKNPCYLMNTLAVRDDQITLIGLTVFEKGKRLGFIPDEETNGEVYITADMKSKPKFDYVINFEDKTVTLQTTMKKRSIKAFYDGEKPVFEVNMRFEAIGLYPSERIEVTDAMRREFARLVKEQVTNDIQRAIDLSQHEYACDYLSFSEPFRIFYPEAYEAMNWHEDFKKAEFRLNITVNAIANKTVDYNPEPIV